MDNAIIFDMDGTLVDTEHLHQSAYLEVMRSRGLDVANDFSSFIGTNSRETVTGLLKNSGHAVHESIIDNILAEKSIKYKSIALSDATLFPGTIEVLETFKSSGFKLAIGTSGSRETVSMIMNKFQLSNYLDTFACMSDVARGKPNPDIFLKASERLGVSPENCVVIEDSKNGILAAKAAGMRVIAVATSFPKEQLGHADLVINHISELTPSIVESVLHG